MSWVNRANAPAWTKARARDHFGECWGETIDNGEGGPCNVVQVMAIRDGTRLAGFLKVLVTTKELWVEELLVDEGERGKRIAWRMMDRLLGEKGLNRKHLRCRAPVISTRRELSDAAWAKRASFADGTFSLIDKFGLCIIHCAPCAPKVRTMESTLMIMLKFMMDRYVANKKNDKKMIDTHLNKRLMQDLRLRRLIQVDQKGALIRVISPFYHRSPAAFSPCMTY
jgi:hypothetical protein